MSLWRRVIAPVIMTPMLLLPLLGCDPCQESQQRHASRPLQTSSPTDPVQKVNGNVITRAEMERATQALLRKKKSHHPAAPADLREARQEALEQLIASELLYQAAQKGGSKSFEQQVERQVAEAMARDRARHASDEAFAMSVKEAGLTLPLVQALIRKELLVSGFIESKFGARVSVCEQEARSFYEANREKFKTGSSVRASQILVMVAGHSQDRDRERARERAEVLLHRVRDGENFNILAQSHSDCPSKARGGDLGFFGKGELDPLLEQAAFALKPGEISEIVQTRFGFHILKVTEKRAPRLQSYDEAKEEIRSSLKKEKMSKLVAEYVTELRGKAKVERVD